MTFQDALRRPTTRTLRQFSLLWVLFFAGMALWQYAGRHNPSAAGILALAAFSVGPAGLIAPRLVRPIFTGWMVLAFPVGWTVSHVLLALLFFGVFTPLGLLFRWIGRDELRLRRAATGSYWAPKVTSREPADYFHQY